MTTRRASGLNVGVLVVAMLMATWGLLSGDAGALDGIRIGLPHFKCYEITPGTALNESVTLFDQFHPVTGPPSGPGQPPQGGEAVTVKSPHLLCTPVSVKCRADGTCEDLVDGGPDGPTPAPPIGTGEDHLKCYKITPSGPPVNQGVTLFDQFHPATATGGGEAATVRTPHLLCAPATKCLAGQTLCQPPVQ